MSLSRQSLVVNLGPKETFQTNLVAGSRRESDNPSESNSSRPSVHSVHSPHLGDEDSPNSERRSGENEKSRIQDYN